MHIGADYLTSMQSWINLLELYGNAEMLIYIISNEKGMIPRKLKYVEDDDLKLIPKDFIDMLEKNMNHDYEFIYDENCKFENQKLLRETKAIFAYIFLHFWGNEKQKKFIKIIITEDRKK